MPVEFDDELQRELEGFELDDVIELLTVNATAIGGGTYFFAPAPVPDGNGNQVAPVFAGNTYMVVPFQAEGFDYSTGGVLPQPVVRFAIAREDGDTVSDAAYLLALLASLDDMLGAQVLRTRTLRKFLDDGSDPNAQAHMGIDVFTVAQKPVADDRIVEFRLKAAIDVEDVQLPRRRAVDYCTARYRVALPGGGFDYADAICPYTGASHFDDSDQAVGTGAEDICSKSLAGCKARFGANAVLPYYGFPGVGKFTRT